MPETQTVFLDHLNSPFGVAWSATTLYVANTDAIMRFPYTHGETKITAPASSSPTSRRPDRPPLDQEPGRKPRRLEALCRRRLEQQHHRERDGGEDGPRRDLGGRPRDRRLAHLRERPAQPERPRVRAGDGALWAVVNERDELGPDLVPDYLTSVKDGGFYGWPYSYYGQHVDPRVHPQRPDLVAKAIEPDYAPELARRAARARPSSTGEQLCRRLSRTAPSSASTAAGTAVRSTATRSIFVPFATDAERACRGRRHRLPRRGRQGAAAGPVGVALDRTGALLVADDVGNTVWRVSRRPLGLPDKLVGETGFEPATLCSQSRCATRLRHSPTTCRYGSIVKLANPP